MLHTFLALFCKLRSVNLVIPHVPYGFQIKSWGTCSHAELEEPPGIIKSYNTCISEISFFAAAVVAACDISLMNFILIGVKIDSRSKNGVQGQVV